jgi:ubiquinone/menaquinone biosynthesis C-methylase UbiE
MGQYEKMRQDWDERAKKNAFYYIATWKEDWDPESFFLSGEQDYQRLVDPVLTKLCFEPKDKIMLEIGCGIGRMTKSFAQRFGRVIAIDVSEKMLHQARTFHDQLANVGWILGKGTDLFMLKGESFDFVFSYLVFHHLPTKELTLSYIREILRVLKKGGVFLFQFNSCHSPTMNWKGRVVWGIIDWLKNKNLERASRKLALYLRLDPLAAGKTWRGVVMDVREVLETIWHHGGVIISVTGWGTQFTWCYGYKAFP